MYRDSRVNMTCLLACLWSHRDIATVTSWRSARRSVKSLKPKAVGRPKLS
ncbi:hypothetical protein FOVG_19993 [Fusarium oxysporum f. sp. pisi HDV247]|uniref:Uncharacterized protein n=1 Tax=Fusarium oxysporum f. sp. pisi HDV247 TaxID=1080344 RepID=W9NKK7_FUSOX|nr:hypothetical protein FOVG_19993 [Fusarium oxysporum f. sp. pisi HDV247]